MSKYFFVLMFTTTLFFSPSTKIHAEQMDINIGNYDYPAIPTTFEVIYVKNRSQIVIILSDGSQWILRNDSDEAYTKISTTWRAGDDIRIDSREPKDFQGKFILKNARNKDVFFVDLDIICMDNSKAYFIQEIDKNGYALFSNGLEWAIGYWGSFTTSKWRKGDRIIINKSSYSSHEDYILINVDKGTDVWASLIIWR